MKKKAKVPIHCRAKRDFWSPEGDSLFQKGFVFTALSGVLRDEWVKRGFIEVIGEEAAKEKIALEKPKEKRERKQPMVRTG